MNPKVDFFFDKAEKWQEEYAQLRTILFDCDLTEEVKWGVPCYTSQTRNIVLIHGFKEYCALLFFKGALLQDAQGLLIQQTENVQAARQMRFTNLPEIIALAATIQAYVAEAIAVEEAGLQVPYKKTAEFDMPEEFITKLEEVPGLQDAFDAMTPGRQRADLLHFAQPKQAKTRMARIEKWVPHILNGKGLDDQ